MEENTNVIAEETEEKNVEETTTTTPPKQKKGPSVRTLKREISQLKKELDEKDAEVQEATDKALMFQEIATNAKGHIEQNTKNYNDTLVTLRGSVINTLNTIDLLLGGINNGH